MALSILRSIFCKTSVVLTAATIFLFGCAQIKSDKLVQSEIYTTYSAKYDEGKQTLSFSASFKAGAGLGGTEVKLSGKSHVDVDGRRMDEVVEFTNQVNYEIKTTGISKEMIRPSYTVYYHDNDGKVYSNQLRIPLPIRIQAPVKVQRTAGLTINWAVSDIKNSDETLIVSITSSRTTVIEMDSRSSGSTGRIVISPARLAEIPDNQVSVQVCRSKTERATSAPEVGGTLSTQYCTAPSFVSIQ